MSALKKFKIKTRAQHIWVQWVLIWGFLTAVLFHLIGYLLSSEVPSLRDLIISFIIFPIAGYFCGVWTWKIARKKTKQSTAVS
jgi:hypothetical protein